MENNLIHPKEHFYFILAVIVSVLTLIGFILSIAGIVIFGALVLISLFLHGISIGHIRNNGIKVTEKQFPELYQKTSQLCQEMSIEDVPDIYILESGGVLNAFATRFFRKNMVVLYSDIVELTLTEDKEALTFVIAHELAHIKRNHIGKNMLILPAMWIPFLAEAYSRGCEYTCDRYATFYTDNFQGSQNGLLVLAAGKQLYNHVDPQEYMVTNTEEKGFFVWLSEKLSTHPPIPKRLYAIHMLSNEGQSQTNLSFNRLTKKTTALVTAFSLVTLLFIGGLFWAGTKISSLDVWAEFALNEGATALMLAVSEDDTETVEVLLENGSDANAVDVDGWTALHWAFYADQINKDIVTLLLEYGADPNIMAYDDSSILTSATYYSSAEMIQLLLDYGADPNVKDSTGWTALMSAASNGDVEVVETLLNAGADPSLVDEQNMSALDYAVDFGYTEVENLLNR